MRVQGRSVPLKPDQCFAAIPKDFEVSFGFVAGYRLRHPVSPYITIVGATTAIRPCLSAVAWRQRATHRRISATLKQTRARICFVDEHVHLAGKAGGRRSSSSSSIPAIVS